MGQYVDRPGIDKAEIVQNGRLYPVVMSIPLGGDGSPTSGGSIPGFEIPPHDTIRAVEDASDRLIRVEYLSGGDIVQVLNFTYDYHAPLEPLRTTTISKGVV